MDIAGLSMANAQTSVKSEASMAILAKGLDAMKQDGAALAKLMESAPVAAPLPEGVGASVDVFA